MRDGDLIRVLGPIDLLTGTGAESVGSAMSRRLLGALVVEAGRAVPISRLEWSLWADDPPTSATGSLHTYVSRLRHHLGPDTIARVDHSYELRVERDQIDAVLFEDLVVEATRLDDAERRLAICRKALALWRGDPFGEFVDDEPFQLEAKRLHELRIAAVELALESELALDHPEIVAAELECAIEEHPYRERLWYLLIEALLRDGQRVKALRVGQDLRDQLAAAGLEPTIDLRELEARVLDVA